MFPIAARPHYHFSPPSNWLSDPNGLVWHAGSWHLYYQHNPHGEDWGRMSWGHARSVDLVEWEPLEPAMLDTAEHFIFSGCAVADDQGRAGFGRDAIIALFTAASRNAALQAQHLAVSHDDGASFVDHGGNPVLDLGMADFRDPNIFWHEPTRRWIMVVARSAEHFASLYGSADLRGWEFLSDIGPWDAPGQVWECPMLIELPVEESSARRWLFKVDALHGGPGSGALGLSGSFDGRVFTPDTHGGQADWQPVDSGSDFYAAVPWHDPRDAAGRPAWIGWTGNHAYQGSLPRQGWRGAMSMPRRLSFRREGDRYRLVQQAEPALAAAFETRSNGIRSGQPEMIALASRLSFDVDAATNCSLSLSVPGGVAIRLDVAGGTLRFDRSAGFHPGFDEVREVTIEAGPVTIWLDGGVIEVESAGGRDWFSAQHRLFGDTALLSVMSGEAMTINLATFAPSSAERSADVEGEREPLAVANRRG